MKAGLSLAVLLLGLSAAWAQETATEAGNSNAAPELRFNASVPYGPEELDPSAQETIVSKNVQISGPVVRPLKQKKLGNVLKGFLQLFNPFTRSEEPDRITRYEGFSSRPWSEIVGWSPGTSAFPDPTTHSPSISLVSFAPAP